MMRRSCYVLATLLGLSLLGSFPAASAYPEGKVWRIGLLSPSWRPEILEGLKEGLRELGYIEGKNLAFEVRRADGKYERLPGLAAELVNLKVDVLTT